MKRGFEPRHTVKVVGDHRQKCACFGFMMATIDPVDAYPELSLKFQGFVFQRGGSTVKEAPFIHYWGHFIRWYRGLIECSMSLGRNADPRASGTKL